MGSFVLYTGLGIHKRWLHEAHIPDLPLIGFPQHFKPLHTIGHSRALRIAHSTNRTPVVNPSSMAKVFAFKARHQRHVDPDNVKPPRPLNKFFLFKKAYVAAWPEPKPENKVMVKAAGEAWKNLPPAEIAHWTRVQEEAATEHARRYPNYKYEPLKKGDKAAARAKVRRRRAEDIYQWDTPSLYAKSLESSPTSTSSALFQPLSGPSSPPSYSSQVEPEVWVPTGGPNDGDHIQEGTLQLLPGLAVETFETQTQAPQMIQAKSRDDWTQYIDPDLLAMDEYSNYAKEPLAIDEPGACDAGLEVELQMQGTLPSTPSPPMACIDPSLLCTEDGGSYID